MKYRAEINGLRALAVIPVILFHAGFDLLSGGFIGVDVFFVISGYLITTLLIEEIENKTFSIINFYERRARRILPALVLVVLITIPFAWATLTPRDLKDFFQSVYSVSTFSSNILFWIESDYFDTVSELKPLLHTWSLAIEEQFYLFFPIFLFFAWRFFKDFVFWMIVVFAILSFFLSEYGSRNYHNANFYLAHTRVWELFAGSIAAFILQKNEVKKSNKLSLLGLVTIIFSIFVYDENTPFPSIYALAPIGGVFLIILYAHKDTFVAKILSIKLFVGTGLISYSAYLLHHPIFALLKYRHGAELSILTKVLAICVTLLAAVIIYFLVEKKFRQRQFLSRNFFLSLSAVTLIILTVFGYVASNNYGNALFLFKEDIYDEKNFYINSTEINSSKISHENNVYIWGDSYAGSLKKPLNQLLNEKKIGLIEYVMQSCPSLLGVLRNESKRMGKDFSTNCKNFNKSTIAKLSQRKTNQKKNKEYIVLTSAYHWYNSALNKEDEPIILNDDNLNKPHSFNLTKSLKKTIMSLNDIGLHPIIILSPITFDNAEFEIRNNRYKTLFADLNNFKKFNSLILKDLENFDVTTIDPIKILCNDEEKYCSAYNQNYKKMIVWYDGSHLSFFGAKLVSKEIINIINFNN